MPDYTSLTLIDDGTLDTVFECTRCGDRIRYTDFEREPDGRPMDGAITEADSYHFDECEGVTDAS